MSRGLFVARAGLALGLLAGVLVSGIVSFGLLGMSLNDRRAGILFGGLGLGVVVFGAAGLSVWLVLLMLEDRSESDRIMVRSRRIAFSLLILIAEIGLAWLTVEFAARHRSGSAWITGALGLAVSGLVFPAWFSGGVKGDEDLVALSLPAMLGEASLGVLAVIFAAEHHPVAAWTLAGLAVVQVGGWMVLPEVTVPSSPSLAARLAFISTLVVSAASVITLVIKFAAEGDVVGASVTGGGGLAAAGFLLWFLELLPDFDLSWPAGARAGRSPAIPLLARLTGLILPVGTIVWAEVSRAHAPNLTAAVHVLTALAWLTLAIVILLAVQAQVITWLRPHSADGIIRAAARHPGPADDDYGPSPRHPYRQQHYERELAIPRPSRSLTRRLANGITQPLGLTPSALSAGVMLAASTGLNADQIWPRLELVVPPDIRRTVARDERIVTALRVAAASSICTAIVWPLSAETILAGVSNGGLAALAGAPVAAAIAFVIVARLRFANLFLRRVDATDVYRFDLVKALHLPLPQDGDGFLRLSRYLMDPFLDRPIAWPEGGLAADSGRFGEGLAREVAERAEARISAMLNSHRQQALRDNAEFLTQQRARFTDWLSSQALGSQELALLADRIADRAAAPVSDGIVQRMAEIEENFTDGLRAVVEEVVSGSVLGPPLANFTGYLTLELHRSSEEDPAVEPSGGTIRTRSGHELGLVMSVVRQPAAASVASLSQGPDGSFLVLEPVVIEGGRDIPIAEFEAIADCATLAPLPRRQSLSVASKAAASFRFKLPEQDSLHELWFQLYQSGRLIQAIAISVEIRPEQVTVR